MIAKEMSDQIERLQSAGYGIIFITHDQDKKMESRSGLSYDKTTVSLDKRARDIVVNMADFIMFIENAVEKGKGDKTIQKRYIYLRADGSDIEAGSRFTKIKDRIEYSVPAFLEAFTEAVENSYEDDSVNIEEIKQQQAEDKKVKVDAYVEKEKEDRNPPTEEEIQASVEELQKEIDLTIRQMSVADKKKAKVFIKDTLGTENFKKCTELAGLQEVLEYVKEQKE
jgi:hypothetical protein